jgi:hypothetical protein
VAAAGPGRGQAGAGAFADEVAFELGQGGEDVEAELAAGSGGVDRLLQAAEPNPTLGQPGNGVDQVAERPPSRSSLQTTRVSSGRSWSRSCSRVGRSAWVPLAVSVNTR